MSLKNKFFSAFFLLIGFQQFSQTNQPPVLTASGNQAFCPQSQLNIVTDFTISDVDDVSIMSLFIQISAGYQVNQDILTLSGSYPTINTSWNATEGKLSLTGVGTNEILYSDLEEAVKDVVFSTSATTITEEKFFSITIGDANYLPSTNHFYEYVADLGITWSAAKEAADVRTYFGLKGYLATLATAEEAILAGEQASGAGWIGGSDEETEGAWKWVTGPDAGTIFWNGQANGSTPNYANWNNNEPNDSGGNEDYAHITDPSIGIRGAWNDLPNPGSAPGPYHPKGYVVEYGGTVGDPVLSIFASTRIYLPKINSITEVTICESGSATISAIPSEGTILWFNTQTGGIPIHTGNSFTTPILNTGSTYYATVSVNGCTTINRTAINVTIHQKPTITSITEDLICSGTGNLSAIASAGDVFWFDSLTSTTPLFIGNNFRTPVINANTTYYAEANIDGCISSTRTAIRIIIDNTIPEFDLVKDSYTLCNDLGQVTLETENAQGNYTYQWKKDNTVISGNGISITINESGNYIVKGISLAGCESEEKKIIVLDSEIATITKDDILITDNSIQIIVSNLGIGDYEFSLDEEFGIYKDDGIFENITTGIHTLFVKDKLGCGINEYTFSILEYPKFFTPNNDGINDFWHIKGFDNTQFTVSDIYIYNRFGILLYKIDAISLGWDGTYGGKRLPSNSYWFKTILTDINGYSVEKKGSFSLIRN